MSKSPTRPLPVPAVRPVRRKRRHRHEHVLGDAVAAREALKRFAKQFRQWRTQVAHLSEQDVADSIGCSAQRIRNLEAAVNYPSFPLFVALNGAMGRVV